MRKYIAFVLMVSLPILFLASCDGGGGTGEEFTVFDVVVDIQEIVDEQNVECPKHVFLKMSLIQNESDISGYAQLYGFGKLGQRVEISGIMEDDSFRLDEFQIEVLGPSGHPERSALRLSFSQFEGVLISSDEDESVSGMEGNVTGVINQNLGVNFCDGTFTGVFGGEVKTPVGCISKIELSKLSNLWNCPANSISNLCDKNMLVCDITSSEPDLPLPPPAILDNTCSFTDCSTLVDCHAAPDITNLQINGDVTGNVLLPEGEGQPVSCSFDF
jgi:hypothetical protein